MKVRRDDEGSLALVGEVKADKEDKAWVGRYLYVWNVGLISTPVRHGHWAAADAPASVSFHWSASRVLTGIIIRKSGDSEMGGT
jgi:hypothetical protein